MNTYDIENYIRTDPVLRRKTIHVITSDIPITGDACVVNTLKSGDHGIGHWFVVATVDGRTELFDSQARLSSVIPHDFTNSIPVQHPLSTACGHHCCLFLSLRFRNLSLTKIIKQYSHNLVLNDKLAYNFVSLVNKIYH